jgi:glycosyl transferase family 25
MIQSFNDIQHIFYINLKKRTDRRAHIIQQLKNVFINATPERFEAVEMNDGRVGCSMSHLRCLQLAKERNYDHIFICEDDTLFLDPQVLQTQFNHFVQEYPLLKWDVILLAGNNLPPYLQIGHANAAIKVSHCQTTTCYLVNQHYYDVLIANIKEGLQLLMRNGMRHKEFAIDKYWLKLQKGGEWFLITPPTVVQRDDYSDIEKKNTNYANLMLDLDKKKWHAAAAAAGQTGKKKLIPVNNV